jgi:CBS domain-containing protein
MQVSDIMTESLVVVGPAVSLRGAAVQMSEHDVGCVVVYDDGLRGILTGGDLLTAERSERTDLDRTPVTALMTAEVVTTTADRDVSVAARTMRDNEVRRLPVTEDRRLVGIVSATDVAWHLQERVDEERDRVRFRSDARSTAAASEDPRRDDWT